MGQIKKWYLLLFGIGALLIIRLLPLLVSPLGHFGYDYGFYRFAITGSRLSFWQNIVKWNNYDNVFFWLTRLFHLPAEPTLTISYILLTLGVGLSLYFLLSNNGAAAGLVGLLLFGLSVPQTESYLQFFWKGAAATIFLLASFNTLHKKRYWLSALSGIGIFLTHHKTTIIISAICFGIYLLYRQLKDKKYLYLILEALGLTVLAFALKPFWFVKLANFLNHPNQLVTNGIFLLDKNSLILTITLFALGAVGLIRTKISRANPFMIILGGISLLWLVFKLPFYHRILAYLDLASIYFAALYISELPKKHLLDKSVIIILSLSIIFNIFIFVKNREPLITQNEVKEIQNITNSNPGSFVLALDSNDAPWLLAYASNARLAAPGLFESHHSYEQWQEFWNEKDQVNFLNSYPKPLLVYGKQNFIQQLKIKRCLEPISETFSKLTCTLK
jgi:hypothetical protein